MLYRRIAVKPLNHFAPDGGLIFGYIDQALDCWCESRGAGMENQLNRGLQRRLMYVENKDGEIDGVAARIGWVKFSRTGQTVYYRGRELQKAKGVGIRGNFFDTATGEKYWISGVKKRGSNIHWAEHVSVEIDDDALDEYRAVRSS